MARIYCQRCRRSLSSKLSDWKKWEDKPFQICEICIAQLQQQGDSMESATKPESESTIQVIMQEREGGEREVETPAGAIDLLTDQEVIEIKHVHNWKDATKVLVYQTYFPDRKPRVHLFGGYSKQTRATIEEAFGKLGIIVTWERDPF